MSNKRDTHSVISGSPAARAFAWGLALAARALPLWADDAAVEARLQALESRLRQLEAENRQLRQELGVGGSGAASVKPAGKESVLTINGLVQVQGEFGDKGDSRGSANDRFRLRRLRLGAAGRFLEEFDFKIEGEYVGTSASLTDGYINWSHFAWANVKAGQFKSPFGYEFLAADPKLLLVERTFGTDRLTLGRQVGVQINGDFFEKRLSYAAGAFNGNGMNVTTNDNENFNYVGRLSGILWSGKVLGQPVKWSAGLDGFTTRDTALSLPGDFGFSGNSFTGRRYGTAADTQVNVGPFDLWAEWLDVHFDPTNHVPAAKFDAKAWYLQGTYFVLPKEVQLAVRYDTFDPNDMRTADQTDTWTFGANWFLKGDDIKLQLNYNLVKVPAPTPRQRQLVLRTQVIF